ncbi:hypothetical protein HN446_03570 [bacterium]|nr:hypothetical protein [bacterium]
MYFLPRTNWFYSFVVKLSFVGRFLITFFVLLFIFSGWYFFIYCPQEEKHVQNVVACLAMGGHADAGEIENGQYIEEKANIKRMRREWGELSSRHRHIGNFTGSLSSIISLAQKYNLVISSIFPCQEEREADYISQSARCVFTGEIKSILQFLRSLEGSENLTVCEDFELNLSSENYSSLQLGLRFYALA